MPRIGSSSLSTFHVLQLCSDAMQEVRMKIKREARKAEIESREKHKYKLQHRLDYRKKATKESVVESLKKWYNKVTDFDNDAFNTFSATIYQREDEILNYFVNRSTNASAESLNAKIKHFRAQLRGVIDVDFFLYRLSLIYV